jgi:hypothetical protein
MSFGIIHVQAKIEYNCTLESEFERRPEPIG